jgi:hypothetical protein
MKINALPHFLAMNPIIRALPSNGQLRFANHIGSRHRVTAATTDQSEFGRDGFSYSMSMSMLMGGDIELDGFVSSTSKGKGSKASKPSPSGGPTPNVSPTNVQLMFMFVMAMYCLNFPTLVHGNLTTNNKTHHTPNKIVLQSVQRDPSLPSNVR